MFHHVESPEGLKGCQLRGWNPSLLSYFVLTKLSKQATIKSITATLVCLVDELTHGLTVPEQVRILFANVLHCWALKKSCAARHPPPRRRTAGSAAGAWACVPACPSPLAVCCSQVETVDSCRCAAPSAAAGRLAGAAVAAACGKTIASTCT